MGGRAKILCATIEDLERAKAALSFPVRVELDLSVEDADDANGTAAGRDVKEDG